MTSRDEATKAAWQQIAVQLGHDIRSSVNRPTDIGTEHETGYILMFFMAQQDEGKSTLVSSSTDIAQLKRLLKFALRNLDKATVVNPDRRQ